MLGKTALCQSLFYVFLPLYPLVSFLHLEPVRFFQDFLIRSLFQAARSVVAITGPFLFSFELGFSRTEENFKYALF